MNNLDEDQIRHCLSVIGDIEVNDQAASHAVTRARETARGQTQLPPLWNFRSAWTAATSAAVVGVVAAFVWAATISPSSANMAFGETQKMLRNSFPLRCTMTVNAGDEMESLQARFLALSDQRVRTEAVVNGHRGVQVYDLSRGKKVSIDYDGKRAEVAGVSINSGDQLSILLRVLQFRPDDFEQLKQRLEIDGVEAIGFALTRESGSQNEKWVVWIDPDSKRALKIELEKTDGRGQNPRLVTFRDFEFRVKLDEAQFNLDRVVPSGFTLVDLDQLRRDDDGLPPSNGQSPQY